MSENLLSYNSYLSSDEYELSQKVKFAETRKNFILSRGFLRKQLSRICEEEPSKISLTQNSYGKPFLSDGSIQFNLSHSEGRIVLALSKTDAVGIDIEMVNQQQALDVAESVFSNYELLELSQFKNSEKVWAFFKGWTQKEAFSKAVGLGLNFPLKKISFSLDPWADGQLLHVELGDFLCPYKNGSLHCFNFDDTYACTLFSALIKPQIYLLKESDHD